MTTRILFFGRLKEIAGSGGRIASLPADIDSAAALIDWLADGDEALRQALTAPTVRIAVDQKIIDRDERFAGPREIAFMPPFSGG